MNPHRPVNYYNEYDPHAAAWLRQLIADGQIPDGHVDDRSITEVTPSDLRGYTQHHWFCGIAGWPLALRLAGWPDDRPVWTASLPCQPFSSAGKQLGTDDERHLAPVFLELVRQCRPSRIIGEQVASKLARDQWLPGIRLELETLGYAFGAVDLCAPCAGEIGEGRIVRGDQATWERVIIGPPHIRQRLYWVADSGLDHTRGGGCVGRAPRSEQAFEGRPADSQPIEYGELQAGSEGSSRDGGLADNHSGGFPQCSELNRETQQDTPIRHSSGGHVDGCSDTLHPADGLPDALRRRHQVDVQSISNSGKTQRVREADVSRSYAAHELLPCRDGKTRRTQSGIFPLVASLPRGVVPSGDPGAPEYANDTAEARNMRLKGYGNAICADLAALFIRSLPQ